MISINLISILLSIAVSNRRERTILYTRTGILCLLCCAFLLYNAIDYCITRIGTYGGLYHVNINALIFKLLILLISILILSLNSFYVRKINWNTKIKLLYETFNFYKSKIINKVSEQYLIIEYSLMLLFIVTGAALLVCTSDIVSIFLSIELQSYGLYLFCCLYKNSESATSASLTYFLLGGLSSCFILLGLSLLYANSGTSNIDGLYVLNSVSNLSIYDTNIAYWYKSTYLGLSLLIMSVGFLFKVSAAPFHFWSPDVYDGVPTLITTFIAIIAKISIFIFLLQLVHYTINNLDFNTFNWSIGLLLSSLLSLIIGTVVGLSQSKIKRLYAYSAISHVGFMLLSLSINSIESVQSYLFYLIQYSITNLNAFVILLAIGWFIFKFTNNNVEYSSLLEKNNSPVQLTNQLRGYFNINPTLSLSLTITIFSFVGIPPLAGFFAKQMVLSSALDAGYIFLVLVAVFTSVIGAAYYLGIIKQMFFDITQYTTEKYLVSFPLASDIYNSTLDWKTMENIYIAHKDIIIASQMTVIISLLTLGIMLFMLIPRESLSLTVILSLILFYT